MAGATALAAQGRPAGGWKDGIRFDVIAGLITAAVVIPKAMAYASIAGLPVVVGLTTALVPMVIYALLGTSRPLSVSTTTTIAILTAAELSEVVPGADPAALVKTAAALALLVGGVLVVASFLRLGFVADFISEPVLVGFKAGIGLVIVFDQLPKLFGVHFPKTGFFRNLAALFRSIPETSVPTLVIGLGTIALLLGLERFLPRVPAPLVVVAAGIAAMGLFGLEARGVEAIGRISAGLPSPVLPDLSLAPRLWPGALAIALMSFTETTAAGRAFARTDEPPLKPNRELLATGLANAGGAFFGAMPAGGGTSQTAVNRRAGARTQLAELVTAAVTLLTMLFLAPWIGLMPQATLAAVVIVYSIGLIQPAEFRAIFDVRRTEWAWALTAFAGVVLLGTLRGILVAIVVSLVALSHQMANPPVRVLGRKPGTNVFRPRTKEHPEDETYPGLLLLRLEGRIFFANAGRIAEKMRAAIAEENPKVVALDMSAVFDLEYTALKMLTEGEKRARERGVSVWLVGLNPEVLGVIQRSSLGKLLGREGMHFTLEVAVAKYQAAGSPAIVKRRQSSSGYDGRGRQAGDDVESEARAAGSPPEPGGQPREVPRLAARRVHGCRDPTLASAGRRLRRRSRLGHVARRRHDGRRRRVRVRDARLALVAPVTRIRIGLPLSRRGRGRLAAGEDRHRAAALHGQIVDARAAPLLLLDPERRDPRHAGDRLDVLRPQAHERAVAPGLQDVGLSLEDRIVARDDPAGRDEVDPIHDLLVDVLRPLGDLLHLRPGKASGLLVRPRLEYVDVALEHGLAETERLSRRVQIDLPDLERRFGRRSLTADEGGRSRCRARGLLGAEARGEDQRRQDAGSGTHGNLLGLHDPPNRRWCQWDHGLMRESSVGGVTRAGSNAIRGPGRL